MVFTWPEVLFVGITWLVIIWFLIYAWRLHSFIMAYRVWIDSQVGQPQPPPGDVPKPPPGW